MVDDPVEALVKRGAVRDGTGPLSVKASEVFGRPAVAIKVPLNLKTTENARKLVRIRGLEPTRDTIPVEGLRAYLHAPRKDPPDILHIKMRDGRDRLVIQEGHTRIGAGILRRGHFMDARVWEFVEDASGAIVPVPRGLQKRGMAKALALHGTSEGAVKGWETRKVGRVDGPLPHMPGRYFHIYHDTKMVPVNKLRSIPAQADEVIARHEGYAREAAAGGIKREPIEVERHRDGTYEVLNGHEIAAVAQRNGWSKLPAHLTTKDAFHAEHDYQHEMRRDGVSVDLGGPGSGNFGHSGRPGEVGGSSADGGSSGSPGSSGGESASSSEPNPNEEFAPIEHARDAPDLPDLGRERPTPIQAKDLGHAVDLILKGQVVELKDIGAVHTVLEKLATMAHDAESKGQKAPNYDLCKVTVAGSPNLFCGSSLKTKAYPNGIPRVNMPQLSGMARPGSPADAAPKNKNGSVNAATAFITDLRAKGITVDEDRVPAAALKASQAQLVGKTVANMMTDPHYDPGKEPIFVSSDGYVLDGHHRWAAVVGRDAADGRLGESRINVRRVDAPISELLRRAKAFTKRYGIEPKKAGKTSLAMIFDGDLVGVTYRGKLQRLVYREDA